MRKVPLQKRRREGRAALFTPAGELPRAACKPKTGNPRDTSHPSAPPHTRLHYPIPQLSPRSVYTTPHLCSTSHPSTPSRASAPPHARLHHPKPLLHLTSFYTSPYLCSSPTSAPHLPLLHPTLIYSVGTLHVSLAHPTPSSTPGSFPPDTRLLASLRFWCST